MKYVRLRVWVILFVVAAGVIFLLKYSSGPGIYQSSTPITDTLITESYPNLYEAISKREAGQLKPFLTHDHPEVRKQAWRALANTSVDSLPQFIELAKEQNSEAAWFGISNQNFTGQDLRELEKSWENSDYRSGILRVLGQQGDDETLNFLLNQIDEETAESEYFYQYALAVGRLMEEFEAGQDEQISIIQSAFNTENYDATKAFLYGWYRGDESRLTATARDTLFNRWQLMGTGISRDVDQYVNKILPARTTYPMTIYYNGEQMLNSQTQLAYELATSIEKIPYNDRNSLAAKILLTNTNPHVQVRVLQSLREIIDKGDDIYRFINNEMINDEMLADMVWLQALQTIEAEAQVASDYVDRLAGIPEKNPYLWTDVLAVYQNMESVDEFLNRIDGIVSNGDPLPTMFAIRSLNSFWVELPEDQQTEDRIDQVRSITFDALQMQDRGVAFTVQSLLGNEELFTISDFNRINQFLMRFSLPGDIEVYQAFGSLYKDRFEQRAEPVIDSLAALGYSPLNRSLSEAGWDVDMSEESPENFLLPDWERIWELGREPVLTVRTQRGVIEMQVNTLSAPATVAMIDSLNRAEQYDGVPFHRVVPNFVIQGGDFERRDGFGGPDFVIPTEASEEEFVRGAVGIASAGTDTEGSQFFIMHQWKPHLNGDYTRFGRVTDGMDVVDKIVEGDSIITTTWY